MISASRIQRKPSETTGFGLAHVLTQTEPPKRQSETAEQYRVLIVNPLARARTRVTEALAGAPGAEWILADAASVDEALAQLRSSRFDAVLVSIEPPIEAADGVVRALAGRAVGAAILVLGSIPEAEVGLSMVRAGADDYVLEHDAIYRALPRILRYAIERRRLAEQCRRVCDKQREIESLLAAVLSAVNTPILVADERDYVRMLNPAFTHRFQWQMKDLAHRQVASLVRGAEGGPVAMIECRENLALAAEVTAVPVQLLGQRWQVFSLHPQKAPEPDVEGTLSALLRSQNGRLTAGRIQMVSMQEIRAKLGERWEGIAERIYESAGIIIRSRLGREDVFTRNADGQFIVCFANLTESDARFKAQTIQKEIRDKLIGEGIDPELASVHLETHSIAITEPEACPSGDFAGMIARKLAQASDELRKRSDQILSRVMATASIELRDVFEARGTPAPIKLAELNEQARAQAQEIVHPGADPRVRAQIDVLVVGRAAEYLLRQPNGRTKLSLITPIDFSTLYLRKYRDGLLAILRQLSGPVRDGLIISVEGMTSDLCSGRVNDILGGLRSLTGQRMLRVETPSLGNVNLRDAAVGLIGMDYGHLANALAHAPKSVTEFRHQMAGCGAQLLIDGVPDGSCAARARQAGADLIIYAARAVPPSAPSRLT